MRRAPADRSAAEPTPPAGSQGARLAGVRLTHPERVLYLEQGLTKLQLAEYYLAMAERILPHLVDRPLSVVRCPRGPREGCFYQKHVASLGAALTGVRVVERDGTAAVYLRVRDVGDLIALVQHGAIEFHPWGSRADRPERPDRLIFDLDPGPGVRFPRVVEAARAVGERLRRLDLVPFVRTSGSKGLHVVVPLARRQEWDTLPEFAATIARRLVAEAPRRFTADPRKSRRPGRVFVDYLRNVRGATAVASYSVRARRGAPVATPLAWEELDGLDRADRWHVGNVLERVRGLAQDPWQGFFGERQWIRRELLRAASE